MQQGLLFEPEVMARTELQDAIARLDFHSALRRLEGLHRFWPEAKLSWEPELVRAGSKLAAKPMDLDSGYGAWQKLEAPLNTLDVSRSWTASLRRNFFSRLLASNRKLFEELRTAAGRSLGDFYLLAEQPRNARRRYENEIRQIGDGWKVRLQLGNCDFRLGHGPVSHSNYHWSFLLGLTEDRWALIEGASSAASCPIHATSRPSFVTSASMRRVALFDIDSRIPNPALMKLSAYYKTQGCEVVLARKPVRIETD